jgi:tetratricopeptide (TPR) repeat protein
MRIHLLPALVLSLLCGTLYAADAPIEVASPHFVVVTDGTESSARQLLDNLERMRTLLQGLSSKLNSDPSAPILVVAQKNGKGFREVQPASAQGEGQLTVAGYFVGAGDQNFIALRQDIEFQHPYAAVYHEYTHFNFRNIGRWMPLWLNEGLAQFYGNTNFRQKEIIIDEPDPGLIQFLRQNNLIPLDVLFKVDHNSPYYHKEDKGSVFYAESYALTSLLQLNDLTSHTEHIKEYLLRLSLQEDPIEAARKSFGDLKKLQDSLSGYIHQEQFNKVVYSAASAPIDSASYKVRTLTVAQFNVDRANLLLHVGRRDDAAAMLKSVLASDPNNPDAYEVMGYLDLSKNDKTAAIKDFAQAMNLNSKSYLAYYYFAVVSMGDPNSAADPRIETSLQTSIQLNPNSAFSYNQLAQWYVSHHQKLDEAQGLMTKAQQLDRTNFYYRLNAANLFMMRGKLDLAQQTVKIAQSLATDTHQKELADNLQQRLDTMKASQPASASPTP